MSLTSPVGAMSPPVEPHCTTIGRKRSRRPTLSLSRGGRWPVHWSQSVKYTRPAVAQHRQVEFGPVVVVPSPPHDTTMSARSTMREWRVIVGFLASELSSTVGPTRSSFFKARHDWRRFGSCSSRERKGLLLVLSDFVDDSAVSTQTFHRRFLQLGRLHSRPRLRRRPACLRDVNLSWRAAN
jgi:hypothetical protein